MEATAQELSRRGISVRDSSGCIGDEGRIVEGLKEEAIGAGHRRALQGLVVRVRGEVDHWQVELRLSQEGGLYSVQAAAQPDVHEKKVGLVALYRLDDGFSFLYHLGHAIAQPLEVLLELQGDEGFVLHYENRLIGH